MSSFLAFLSRSNYFLFFVSFSPSHSSSLDSLRGGESKGGD